MISSSVRFFTVLLCLGASLQIEAVKDVKKVQLTLLYESLCPGCRLFIREQLYPSYRKLGSQYIDLELVPYGNVKESVVNGAVVKSCQHGTKECYGNKVHGCVLQHNSIDKSLEIIHCAESSGNPTSNTTLERCLTKSGVSWADVQTCLGNGEADKIFEKNGEITKKYKPEYVPYIIFNGVFNETIEYDALDDLTSVVCNLLQDEKPKICSA